MACILVVRHKQFLYVFFLFLMTNGAHVGGTISSLWAHKRVSGQPRTDAALGLLHVRPEVMIHKPLLRESSLDAKQRKTKDQRYQQNSSSFLSVFCVNVLHFSFRVLPFVKSSRTFSKCEELPLTLKLSEFPTHRTSNPVNIMLFDLWHYDLLSLTRLQLPKSNSDVSGV